MKSQDIVSDEELQKAFAGTNFGSVDHRTVLEQSVLKALCGHHSGHTATRIMEELGLRTVKGTVTAKGKAFCLAAFYRRNECG